MLVGFVKSLRHAKALLCIHLDCNPGINEEVLKYYTDRIRCREMETPLNIEVNQKSSNNQEGKEKSPMNVWGKMHLEKQYRIEEVCQYINNQRLKSQVCKKEVKVIGEGLSLGFTRVLG